MRCSPRGLVATERQSGWSVLTMGHIIHLGDGARFPLSVEGSRALQNSDLKKLGFTSFFRVLGHTLQCSRPTPSMVLGWGSLLASAGDWACSNASALPTEPSLWPLFSVFVFNFFTILHVW